MAAKGGGIGIEGALARLEERWCFAGSPRLPWSGLPEHLSGVESGAQPLLELPETGEVTAAEAAVVVLCGEGDFSFARALVEAHRWSTGGCQSPKFVCTSLDDAEVVRTRYPTAEANLAKLAKLGNVAVLHGVDATKLADDSAVAEACATAPLGRIIIIFNFPHHCGKGRIDLNRRLLASFFASAGAMVRARDGTAETDNRPPSEVYVSLAPGQGGTIIDGDARREWGNCWQVSNEAQRPSAALVMRGAFGFDAEGWRRLGYAPRGRRGKVGSSSQFRTTHAVTHLFVPEQRGVVGVCCPVWPHDFGLWCNWPESEDEQPSLLPFLSESQLYSLVLEVVGRDRLEYAADGRVLELVASGRAADLGLGPPRTPYERARERFSHRRTYRVRYRGSGERAVSKEHSRDVQLELRRQIEKSGLPVMLT